MKLNLFRRNYPALFCLTIIGVLHVFIYKLILIDIPEPLWFQKASEIGDILYNLQSGFLASIIFFYLVVFLKEARQKALVSIKVKYQSELIISEGLSLFFNFTNGEKNRTFPPSREYCKKQCLAHDSRRTITNNDMGVVSWRALIKNKFEAISIEIENLNDLPITMTYFQNDELIGIITRLRDASLFSFFNRRVRWIWIEPKPDQVSDISHIEKQLHDFFHIIFDLMEIHEKEFGENSLEHLKRRYLLED